MAAEGLALPIITILGCWGAFIVGAIYLLRAMRQVLHGPAMTRWNEISDALHLWRKLPFLVLIVCLLLFGCFPALLANKIKPDAAKTLMSFAPQTVNATPGLLQANRK